MKSKYYWQAAVLSMTVAGMAPATCLAHVKWFCATADSTQATAAWPTVLTPVFFICFFGFGAALFLGTMADSAIARRWPWLAMSHVGGTADFEEKLMRVAIGAFFLCLWDKGAVVPWSQGEAILTPELVTGAPWVSTVQFLVAAALLWRRTCVLAAVGIVVMYWAGIVDYGLFHMVDYIFFMGIACYLALTGIASEVVMQWRVPIVCASLSASLMWTAVEKFLFPQWTISVLLAHPAITAGIAPPIVTVIAGFVEFSLAFFLSTGIGLLPLGSGILLLIFAVAIPEFGHLDAVGHFTIIGVLGVISLAGPSRLHFALRPRFGLAIGSDAAATVAVFIGMLIIFFCAYDGLHYLEYR